VSILSIYKKVLGDDFARLHPMLQMRYELVNGSTFEATGIMRDIKGGPKWLYPLFRLGVNWKLLFPERGKNIPFSIKNTAYIGANGDSQIQWQRIFQFCE